MLFERLLGIHAGNAGVLKEGLAALAASEPMTRETTKPFGRKYEVRGEVRGPLGTKRVVSVWIIDEGGDVPRLVTGYVE